MRLHEYSVFARFRYNDLKVGISSGNQALKRCAFPRTYPGTLSGLPVIRDEFGTIVSACVGRSAMPTYRYESDGTNFVFTLTTGIIARSA
jgi:hypothetical protein